MITAKLQIYTNEYGINLLKDTMEVYYKAYNMISSDIFLTKILQSSLRLLGINLLNRTVMNGVVSNLNILNVTWFGIVIILSQIGCFH